MIVVDTSALIAILLNEPERRPFRDCIEADGNTVVSACSLVEARMVAHGRGGERLVSVLDALVEALEIEVAAVDSFQAAAAHAAFIRYGRGSGHPAQLNFGDLFSYALAKVHGVPLLFKGDDFRHTDIEPAHPGN
jgi:ribonuclease VapC